MTDETVIQEPEVRTAFNEARQAAELIPVGKAGVELQNFAQQVDMAKWIAKGGFAIPMHLRENVGACLAVLDISQRWGFSPYQVARLCYVVNDQLAFMAQLVVAVINKFAPLKGRLQYRFEGEGDGRICIVTGTPTGETEELEYKSPPIAKITPKNSPLWKTDPDQQLAYLAGTRFCRRHFPEILIGIYSPEELLDAAITPHLGAERAKDITPDTEGLHERLKSANRNEGFREGVVEDGLSGTPQKPRPRRRRQQAESSDEGGDDAKDDGEPSPMPPNAPDLTSGEPQPPQATEIAPRPQPMRQRPAQPDSPEGLITGTHGDAPPPHGPGASTPNAAAGGGARSEGTDRGGGGELLPKNYDEYNIHLKAWLGFVKPATRIKLRYAKEQMELWPKFNPKLTEVQEQYFDGLVSAAMKALTSGTQDTD